MAAEPGSNNRAKGKRFQLALQQAIAKASEGKGTDQWAALTEVAGKLIEQAQEGNIHAIKEIADRLDGKSAQQINLADADGDKLQVSLIINGLPNAGG